MRSFFIRNRTITLTILCIASVLSLIAGLVGSYTIYQNNKTDGFNSGVIAVNTCREKDWSWRIYSCTGNYRSNAGMIWRDNVAVTVFGGELKAGDYVNDVYAPAFSDIESASTFITGRERASVAYNMPWLLTIFGAIALSTGTLIYAVLTRKSHKATRRA